MGKRDGQTTASRIVVEFAGPGVADPLIRFEGVTIGQILSATGFLEHEARQRLLEVATQRALGGLSLPGLGIPPEHLHPKP